MNGKYLLDTNIVAPLLAKEPQIAKQFERENEVFIPVIVNRRAFAGKPNIIREMVKTEEHYQQLVALLDGLIDEVGEDESLLLA